MLALCTSTSCNDINNDVFEGTQLAKAVFIGTLKLSFIFMVMQCEVLLGKIFLLFGFDRYAAPHNFQIFHYLFLILYVQVIS